MCAIIVPQKSVLTRTYHGLPVEPATLGRGLDPLCDYSGMAPGNVGVPLLFSRPDVLFMRKNQNWLCFDTCFRSGIQDFPAEYWVFAV